MNEITRAKIESPIFWGIFVLIIGMVLLLQVYTIGRPQPSDVLKEVRKLREEIAQRTVDRFFRKEFENFLEQNPELNRPTVRVEVVAGEEIVTKIIEE